jgi:Asp-tRNA(Asn)/Glu-tRNA(Gln) amidotransferase A subunit family amidase
MHTVGPMCRYTADLAPMLSVMCETDEKRRALALDTPVDVSTLTVYYIEGIGDSATSPLSVDMRRALTKVLACTHVV